MKKHRILAATLAAFTMIGASVGMASCSLPDPHVIFPFLYESSAGNGGNGGNGGAGGSSATMTGYYTSNKVISWQNMTPVNNFYFMVINEQSIETFEDSTYCLTVTAQMFSNVHYGPEYRNEAEDPDYLATSNEQPHIITKYYGTYAEVETKKSSITISLGMPDRVFYAKQGGMYYDTANWTDKMTDGANGLTANDYLKSKLVTQIMDPTNPAFGSDKPLFADEGLSVYIKTTGCSFEALTDFIVTYIG